MKKKYFFLLFVFCFLFNSQSQNLVPNFSFETISQCPNSVGQIYYSTPWFQPSIFGGNTTNSSTSELLNACNLSGESVPNNMFGTQNARTGVSYAGIFTYTSNADDYREYIEIPLLLPLISNHYYCVEFYVSLADSYQSSVSNFGAYFSIDSLLDTTADQAIDYVTPQIENPALNMLADTTNWMLVSGSFIATGGEKFITIGNFHNSANTNTQNFPWRNNLGSYYYIDDVSVIDCTNVRVQEENKETSIYKLYPNPNNGNFSIENNLNLNEAKSAMLTIYELSGRIIKQQTFISENKKTVTVNVANLNPGAYYYEIKEGENIVKSDKLIIIK